jgi:hypothetical protein
MSKEQLSMGRATCLVLNKVENWILCNKGFFNNKWWFHFHVTFRNPIEKEINTVDLWRNINISVLLTLDNRQNFLFVSVWVQDLGTVPLSVRVPVQTHVYTDVPHRHSGRCGRESGDTSAEWKQNRKDQMAGAVRVMSRKENSPKMHQWHYYICWKKRGLKREPVWFQDIWTRCLSQGLLCRIALRVG